MSRHERIIGKSGQRGMVTVEFAILLPLLVAFLVGTVEFGHILWIQHALTNASREAARFAVVYRVDATGTRFLPPQESLQELVKSKYLGEGFVDRYGVTVSPPQVIDGELTFTVTATQNTTLLLESLIQKMGVSGFPDKLTLSSSTKMKLE